MMKRTVPLLALAMMQAAHGEVSRVEWNGFLNVVGGMHTREPNSTFGFDPPEQRPASQGYSEDFTFEQQTSAGLQAQSQLNEQTRVTMQLFAEGDVDGYKASMKWLYATWQPNHHSSFKIGKIGAPLYYFSDYLNVGYAYHWISPPESVYPFDSTVTGISYTFQEVSGDFDWSLEVLTGSGEDYLPATQSYAVTRNGTGLIFNIATGDWLSMRAMLYSVDTTFLIDGLSPENLGNTVAFAVNEVLKDPAFANSADVIRPVLLEATRREVNNGYLVMDDVPIGYGNLAVRAETERWLLMTEWNAIRTDTYLYNDSVTRFVTAGMRDDDMFYHITLAAGRSNPHKDVASDRRNMQRPVASMDDLGSVLASSIRSMIAGGVARSTEEVIVGVRHDATENVALKLEVSHMREKESFDGDNIGVGNNTLIRAALNATF